MQIKQVIQISIDNKVSFAGNFLIPIENIVLGFGLGVAHGYWEQQAGMYIYEDPSNAGLFVAPLITGLVEPFALMVTQESPNGNALVASLIGMYPAIIAGKYVGRTLCTLQDKF